MLPFKKGIKNMINTNELVGKLNQAVEALDTATAMRTEMEASIIPLTIDAVNTMFQRIQNNIEPIIDVIAKLMAQKGMRNLISGTKANKYGDNGYYVEFSIVDIKTGVCIPVIPNRVSPTCYYAFGCSNSKENVVMFKTASGDSVYNLCYKDIDQYIPANFESLMYEAVAAYVHTVLNYIKRHTASQIEKTNKLTETLRRIAGDDIVNEILCKNIHVGNGIDGVRIHDGKVVVDICGQEYILNATKM
jgi:hypothetical protein